MQPRKRKCPWCGRDGVPVTKKGSLQPHLTPGGMRCMSAVAIEDPTTMQKRRPKGPTQRSGKHPKRN